MEAVCSTCMSTAAQTAAVRMSASPGGTLSKHVCTKSIRSDSLGFAGHDWSQSMFGGGGRGGSTSPLWPMQTQPVRGGQSCSMDHVKVVLQVSTIQSVSTIQRYHST
mmetsp:Transcript_77943/g.137424  ORF Transcript_77943/g.137424 Transcript_77943/m.137424 type:complete len:107 (-) Transcript_77943:494-814(-)